MLNKSLLTALLLLSFAAPGVVKAQTQKAEGDDLDVIELELDKAAPGKQAPANAAPSYSSEETPQESAPLTDFKGLGTLAPFKEISIVQKRYMPKTGRFQLFGGVTTVTNDPFFNTFGGVAKAAYFLNETWGLELNYFGLTTSERQSTKELQDNNNVKTESLAYPKSYIGVDVMYVPIYGKMTWFNERILPFDMYFSAGYGTTNTSTNENSGTIHLATGQMFALTKSVAFRWDFSWNFFNASVVDQNGTKSTNSFNNLFLTVGMSWFFPEASYR
ncbi:outer membrane beta-barrel domain-containing protein [Bdellovibrio svalbardensis]|uniref:Outer membrane beta-barrel domain-containing protein n=1 Tax=Bdellovibrio svalbardensis TaxID=2972972 RepID=A0ABT6DIZ4_9BACT|nr:outer membrane beta-barrel domain-containing protein [Bdellovibrio svalbardensis]MDG0816763.1 outer membrane beta-barrel domain-containing protein [Bdellovibrio svalbardensis]